jgi:glucosamine--fructose-6-phosphate aminotransferase (isomerizing)
MISVNSKYNIIENDYVRDILDQPRALEATLRGLHVPNSLPQILRRLEGGELRRIVLTGMGSSFYALHPLHVLLNSYGITTVMLETSELVHYFPKLLDRQTLIVAVSQSGRSAEIVRLLDENKRRAQIIGVTNTEDSPLAFQADSVLLTSAGQEFSVSCKTYVTALMALGQLGSLLVTGDRASVSQTLSSGEAGVRESTTQTSDGSPEKTASELAQAAPAVRRYLDSWRDHALELAACLEGVRHLFLVGRGGSLAAAGTGGLIIKESTHRHSEGMSSAAFRHGPFEMLNEEMFVLVFAGDEKTRALNVRLVEDIRQNGGRAELLGKDAGLSSLRIPEVAQSVLPILEILPVEMVTLALAAQTGNEAGRFTLGSKVTTIE